MVLVIVVLVVLMLVMGLAVALMGGMIVPMLAVVAIAAAPECPKAEHHYRQGQRPTHLGAL